MSTVKKIFNYIQSLNPQTSTMSSIGTFVTAQSQQISDSCYREVVRAVNDKSSLAFKVLDGNDKFSDKQLWVIAFELEKNIEFSKMVEDFYDKIESKKKFKKGLLRKIKLKFLKKITP